MPAIDILPNEILILIFEETQFLNAFHRLVPFELVCSHVCSRWRSVALEAPSLWSTIVAAECKPLDRVVTYLSRSGLYPLHIQFDYTHEGREEHVQSLIAFSKLLPCLHRSLSLRMRMSEKMFQLFHERLVHLHAPLLTHLSISVVEDSPVDRSDEFNIGLGVDGLPSLRLVHLSGFKPLQCCFPPLSTVTILHLHQTGDSDYPSLTYPQLCQIINASPLLEKLSLHGEVLTSWNPPLGSLEANNLHSLTIKFIPVPSFLFCLFTVLEAPKLHELSLISISDTDMDPVAPLSVNGTSRIYPSVSQLLLDAPRLTMRMLPRFCKIVPYVTELTVRGGMTVEMEIFLRQSKRWPRLHTLELLGSTHRVKWLALNAILDARIMEQKPLKVVRVPNASEEQRATVEGKVEVRVVEKEIGYRPWWVWMEQEPWWLGDSQDWRE